MKLELTIGPITILRLVMFEATEDLAEPEIDLICEPCPEGETDIDRRIRGED